MQKKTIIPIETRTEAVKSISVTKERLSVDTVKRIEGEVVIEKSTKHTDVDVPLGTVNTEYAESRIPMNIIVDKMPEVRTEGDTLIIPVVREEAVVVKRLVLVEEIHMTKKVTKTEKTVPVTLSEDIVTVTRKDK